MKNGEKWNIEDVVKDFTRTRPDTDMGVSLDKGRLLLSSKYSGMEVRLYSYVYCSHIFCICMGHIGGVEDAKSIISSIVSQRVSKIHNIVDSNANNIIGTWSFDKSNLNSNNIASDFSGSFVGYFVARLNDFDWGGVDFSRMVAREVEGEGGEPKCDVVDFYNYLRLISCRVGEVLFDVTDLHPARFCFLSSKKEIQSDDKYGKCGKSFCMESFCSRVFDLA